MKIIYDENKIPEIKRSADKQNEESIAIYKDDYKKIIRLTAIVSIICFLMATVGFCAVVCIEYKQTLSIFQIFISAIIITLLLGISIFSLGFHIQEREFRSWDFSSYEKKCGEFSYPVCVEYNLFVEDKEVSSFSIIGNPNEKFVDIEVFAKNSEEKLETIALCDFEVYRTPDYEETIIDLMNTRVIYPLEDETQKFEFCPVFEGEVFESDSLNSKDISLFIPYPDIPILLSKSNYIQSKCVNSRCCDENKRKSDWTHSLPLKDEKEYYLSSHNWDLTKEEIQEIQANERKLETYINFIFSVKKEVKTNYLIKTKLKAITDFLPPWIVFPLYPASSLGWRMGNGEEYLNIYHCFISSLTNDELALYKETYPKPCYLEMWG